MHLYTSGEIRGWWASWQVNRLGPSITLLNSLHTRRQQRSLLVSQQRAAQIIGKRNLSNFLRTQKCVAWKRAEAPVRCLRVCLQTNNNIFTLRGAKESEPPPCTLSKRRVHIIELEKLRLFFCAPDGFLSRKQWVTWLDIFHISAIYPVYVFL